MFDNLCKSWPRESQQCINRLKNKQTSYRVLNTVLIKVLHERCGSWPQKCYGDGYSTGWLRHFIATRRYEFFNFRSAEARHFCRLYNWCQVEIMIMNSSNAHLLSYLVLLFCAIMRVKAVKDSRGGLEFKDFKLCGKTNLRKSGEPNKPQTFTYSIIYRFSQG